MSAAKASSTWAPGSPPPARSAFPISRPVVLLPLLTALGFVGGGALGAASPGVLRALRLVNETISTLLLNYVAPLIVSYLHLRAVAQCGKRVLSAVAGLRRRGAAADLLPLAHPSPGCCYALACLALYWLRHDAARASGWRCGRSAAIRKPRGVSASRSSRYIFARDVRRRRRRRARRHGGSRRRSRAGWWRSCRPATASSASWCPGWPATAPSASCSMSFLFAVISSVGDILQITQGVPLRGGQHPDGGHPVHRARPAGRRSGGTMNAVLHRRRSRQRDPVGDLAALRHARRAGRRTRRHRQSRPRRHHADRRGGRVRRHRADRQSPISASPPRRSPARPPISSSPMSWSAAAPISSPPGLTPDVLRLRRQRADRPAVRRRAHHRPAAVEPARAGASARGCRATTSWSSSRCRRRPHCGG